MTGIQLDSRAKTVWRQLQAVELGMKQDFSGHGGRCVDTDFLIATLFILYVNDMYPEQTEVNE